MKKEYWFVIITYIAMQLSSIVGMPIFMLIGSLSEMPADELKVKAAAYWIVFSFLAALTLILILMRKDMRERIDTRNQASIPTSILWAIAGVFLALIAQSLAGSIEQMLGVKSESENTQNLISLIYEVPMVIFVTSVIGPILEEILFRKIIFGSLNKRFNFFISALISSVIFGLAHGELEHLLLYSAMGFTFAFLYAQTGRILVSMVAHIAMNTLVIILQVFYRDDIEKMLDTAQAFIGGLL
ncbi:CPBP family intramembrane metalloprotease [Peribacillus sp. TH16]|uniref:CPBP family intramembrane glutamic endopeptidase n=1 Tax=unclassified Peribacillus TaxID=2675266 RepID=UPI00191414AF|nr:MULTISPECIES: CPBP family intramembrane glutamic endopeptidase [unclassified Peribacillus]MBK5444544.1 CPBP family intramembrane metalloprotease [Peribacillus sp. TH24]MBK5460751.1 CPBP family intramembrane metalloprotease [Peribacillus sp. TH27]MBK5485934.1 CPBP family intramembrane metalloprotease [Peribacillus sp. TH16]WMX55998.1 CPBP family intramembrane metalloprotease [Peribacillus sp. R9-11]